MSLKRNILDLRKRKEIVLQGGGEDAIKKQAAMGKLTARERIEGILDKGSFHEYDMFVEHQSKDFDMDKKVLHGDGVVIGTGTVYGEPVAIYAQDFTVAGGSLGLMHARKITKIMDHAIKMRMPIIGINDSGGARIQEGVDSLAGYGEIFFRNTQASGVIPQLSVILGPCAGGAVYSPALTDFVFVVDNISKMFITGPEVVKTVLGEEVSMEDLGGARVHACISGNAHFFASTEAECFEQIKKLLTFIPWNNQRKAKAFPSKAPKAEYNIEKILPADPTQPYDVRDIIKAGRFIRFCDAFNIPIVTFEDMPGYLPGVEQEYMGVIRHGAKVLYAYSEATVPKVTVILRKAYGGGYIAMNSRHLKADFMFAWPTAEIAVMGPEGAANIIFRKEIKESANPEETRKQKVAEYREKFANPYVAASKGYIDSVIEPSETRLLLKHSIEVSGNKTVMTPAKKHGIPPF